MYMYIYIHVYMFGHTSKSAWATRPSGEAERRAWIYNTEYCSLFWFEIRHIL